MKRTLLNLVADRNKLAEVGQQWNPHKIIRKQGKEFNISQITGSQPWVAQVVNASYRVMYVRHPFTRLASAYLDKIAGDPTNDTKRLNKHVLHSYRPGVRNNESAIATFPEFVDYVIDILLNAGEFRRPAILVSPGEGVLE